MTADPDALDVLLVEIRKTIKDNRNFLENLGDETPDETDTEPDDTYEEL